MLWAVSGKDPTIWYGNEEDQVVNMVLNITDKQAVSNYSQMREVTRGLSALAKFWSGVSATPPMNSTKASIHGPNIDTFMGPQGYVTVEDYDKDEDKRGLGECTGDEGTDGSDNEEEETVMTAESTMVHSLPCAQPRLSDMSVARV